MRTVTYSKVLYTFDELNDKAKDRARDRMRDFQAQDSYWSESVIEDFVSTVAPCFGWTIGKARGRNTVPAVYWSGFSSQGDGACFEGSWNWTAVKPAALIGNCPKLLSLMARLVVIFEGDAGETLSDVPYATVTISGRYCHAYSAQFETQSMTDVQESEFADVSRDLMTWLYRSLEREYNYQNSDDVIDENIRANEYEFDEYGNLTN